MFTVKQKGQAMLEVVITISILIGVIMGLVVLSTSVFSLSKKSVNETQAAYLAQEGFEAIRKIRDLNWDDIGTLDENQNYYLSYDTETKTWSLTTTPSNIDGYERIIQAANALREDVNVNGEIDGADPINPNGTLIDTDTKKIVITISWIDRSNAPRSYSAKSYLTNWR